MGEKGFTLLELMISFILISFVLLILGASLRTGIRAYERAKTLGGEAIYRASLLNLFEKQTRLMISRNNPLTRGYYRFRGDKYSLIFSTTIAPQAASGGGMFLVYYSFNNETGQFSYCQRPIVVPGDLRVHAPENILTDEDIDEARKDGWECTVSREKVGDIVFKYTSKKDDVAFDVWDDEWHALRIPPKAIAIGIKQNETTKWYPFFLDDLVN